MYIQHTKPQENTGTLFQVEERNEHTRETMKISVMP